MTLVERDRIQSDNKLKTIHLCDAGYRAPGLLQLGNTAKEPNKVEGKYHGRVLNKTVIFYRREQRKTERKLCDKAGKKQYYGFLDRAVCPSNLVK